MSIMKKRLLVGPFIEAGLSDYMVGAFDDFDTLTFGSWPKADIQIPGLPSLQEIIASLPPDWAPDFLILWRPEYGYFPPGLEYAQCPVAMLISDWYLAFSDSLESAWRVDMVITGTLGQRIFRKAGFDNVLAMPMLGYQPEIDGEFSLPAEQRGIDIYLGGNPNWAIHRQREQIIAELLDLPPQIKIFHGPYVDRKSYNQLLGRSKIVVNQTVIGEINMKAYEVAAAGACLFVEEDNLDIRNYLVPDESVVLFNKANLLEKIRYFLSHDQERSRIARAAQKAMAKFTYQENFRNIIGQLDELNQAGKLADKRLCFELPEVQRNAGMLGYSLLHNGGDPLAPIMLSDGLPLDPIKEPLLKASAHFLARLGSKNSPQDDRIWPTEKILKTFRDATDLSPDYLPAAYCWARVAAAHLAPSVALPLLGKVTNLLLGRCTVPFSCSDFYFMDTNIQFSFERTAWEALDKGLPLDDILRPLILEDVLVISSRLAIKIGDLKLAAGSLKLAITHYPQGVQARPLLAEILEAQEDWEPAAAVWREHLVARPLHSLAHEKLMALADRCEGVVISDAEAKRYGRVQQIMSG